MSKFRSKPVYVDAFQWNAGDVVDGVIPRDARIRYSDDRKLFYIEKNMVHPEFWMSAEKQPGEATDAQKKAGFLEPGTAQFKLKDGEQYCRTILYFNSWKVRQYIHLDEPIAEDDPLFLDYASMSGWTADILGPAKAAYMPNADGSRMCFKSGDWVITDDKGRKSTMTDEAFRRTYEELDSGFIMTEDEVQS